MLIIVQVLIIQVENTIVASWVLFVFSAKKYFISPRKSCTTVQAYGELYTFKLYTLHVLSSYALIYSIPYNLNI